MKNQKEKFTIFKDKRVLVYTLSTLNKDEVEALFNKSQIFSLSEKEKAVVEDYINNFETNIIKTINQESDMSIKVGDFVIKKYVNAHIDDVSFIEKLSKSGKRVVTAEYIDYRNIKDGDKFIENFLKDLPKENFSCFISGLLHDAELNSNQQKIGKYILNEKTKFDSLSMHWAVQIFPMLSDDNKSQLMGSLLKVNRGIDIVSDYINTLSRNYLQPDEKLTLQEMKKIFDGFVLKENEISGKGRNKTKKNKIL